MPGSPFNDEKLTEAQKALLYAKYGLDKPFLVQFWNYLTSMLKGDFGVSYVINKNYAVFDMVKDRLLVSCRIGLQAMILGSIVGLSLGIAAAIFNCSVDEDVQYLEIISSKDVAGIQNEFELLNPVITDEYISDGKMKDKSTSELPALLKIDEDTIGE